MKTIRIGAYLRVSTSDGRQTTSTQLLAVKRYIESRENWKLVEVFEDHASGGSFDREGLLKLKEAVEKKQIDVIVVWKLDRLVRSTID